MTRSKYKKQFAFLDVNEAPSEETLRDQEANILQLGEKLREEGKTKEMTDLIQKVRHFLRFMSKAKAAKLVRGLVDMFLEMERSDPRGDREVQLCKVNIEFILKNDRMINFNFAYFRNVLSGQKKRKEPFYASLWNLDSLACILKQNVTRKP